MLLQKYCLTTQVSEEDSGSGYSSDRKSNPLTCIDHFSVLDDYYVVIATLPVGARNIKIEEATASENNLCKYNAW